MKSLEESFKRRALNKTAPQDEDDLFGTLLASQLKQLPSHQKLMVKMEINNLVYRSLLSVANQGVVATNQDQRANQSNQGMSSYEEGVAQYHPGYFFNNCR